MVPACPGCGWHEETQIHMFQCRQPLAVEARATAYNTMMHYYHEKQIPALIYKPFIRMCKAVCNITLDDPVQLDSPPIIQEAIKQQQQLGPDFLLRGYLTPKWLRALQKYANDKPEVKMTHLYLGLWRILFATVWEQRNTTANSEVSIVDKIKRTQFIKELIGWKREQHTRLSYTQHYLVSFDVSRMMSWSTSNMRVTLELLVRSAINYRRSLATNQRLITEFMCPVAPTYDDNG